MNNFPFTPFLVSLESDGFCFTLHDYERISMVLRSGGDWSINRLRFVLVSLLVKDNDQKSLFLKRFDEFFDLSHEDEAGFAEIDLDKALDDLRKLAGGDFDESGTSRPAGFRKPRRSSVFDKKSGTGSWWRTGFLALLLVCSLSQFFFNFGLRVEPVIIQPDISIIYKPPVDKNNAKPSSKSDEKERYRLYKNLPYVKDIIPVSPGKIEDWKKIAGAAGVLLTVILAYAFFLWKSHKIPKDKPPKWDKHGPRHFRVGSIGGKMSRFLDPDTLDQLGDLLGYFQSEHPGKLLNMPASIKDTIDRGVSSLVFRKRRQIYNLLILEDAFSESLAWNTVAGELAEGLEQRAIPVTYGRFDGSPGQFKTLDGSVFRMEDLEDQHRGYLVLIFSDGRGLHRQQDAFVLESLARWPMIAWMELREPRFWDESTDWPASYGIPVYPATKDGLVLAMGRFLTEQGTLEDFNTGRVDCRGILGRGAGEVRAYTERLLGDALVWAQACAMIQPVTVGMADALRGEFHELLPCERVERLFALPGTLNTVSGLKFSVPVLSVLRSGFVIHRNEEQQEQVLRFLLEKIRGAEPAEKGSVAYLAWEWQYERVRLELEPEKALKRLAELAAPGSLLASYVTSDMGNVGVGSGEFGDDDLRVPLRVRPKGRYALQRLGRIAKNSGIDVRESFPVGRKHWIAFCLLVLSFFGMLGWTCITYINFLQSVIQIYHNTKGDYIPVILEFKDSDIWQISSPFVIRSVLDDKRVSISATHDIKKNKECRITLFNSGKHYIKKLGVINESLEILFDVKNELRLCKETFEKIGLTIVRCPEGYNEEITLPTWRESLGDAVSENRLMSIGVVIQASEDEEKMLKPVEKLFESYSIDVLYRISLGTDGQLHLPEAFQQIQEDLGAWTEQCQVIVWPNYINKQGLTLADTEHFGRILAFGDEGGSEWVETFVKILEPAKELLVSEDELSVLPSVQVEGKGSPPLALIHSTKLDLSGISDLDTIKDFKYLTWLTLNSTQVSDLSPLKNLKNLSHLSFSNTQVGDLSPLKDLKNLSRLFLNKTQVTDLSPLRDLKKLSWLDFGITEVTDLSPLKDLKNLSDLFLGATYFEEDRILTQISPDINSPIKNLNPLKDLKNLSDLYLSSTQVNDLSPLKDLKNLSKLHLRDTQVGDLSPLKDLKNLSYLNLDSTQVSDLSPLKDLKNLSYLYLSSTQVSDLSPLKDLKNLSYLSLSSTQVSDLSPLKDLKNLSSLSLSSTQMSGLKDLKNLSYLYLSSTQVSDLSPLKDLKNLSSLDLSFSQVSDLSPLKDLKNLSSLDLSFSQVSDLSPLKDLKNLSSLDLRSTQVSNEQIENLKKAIPRIRIIKE